MDEVRDVEGGGLAAVKDRARGSGPGRGSITWVTTEELKECARVAQ